MLNENETANKNFHGHDLREHRIIVYILVKMAGDIGYKICSKILARWCGSQ